MNRVKKVSRLYERQGRRELEFAAQQRRATRAARRVSVVHTAMTALAGSDGVQNLMENRRAELLAKTLKELKGMAKERQIRGRSRLITKKLLVEALL